uniref:Ribbon-helix-helix protein, CopG family n=2 Tax=Thermorudis TaxID=1649508 RepID=A0A7C2WHA0_9BACT
MQLLRRRSRITNRPYRGIYSYLSVETIERLDELVRQGRFVSRSHAVDALLSRALAELEREEQSRADSH